MNRNKRNPVKIKSLFVCLISNLRVSQNLNLNFLAFFATVHIPQKKHPYNLIHCRGVD